MSQSSVHYFVLEPVTPEVQALVQALVMSPVPASWAALTPAHDALSQCAQRLADAYARAAPGSQQRQDFRTLYDAVQGAIEVLMAPQPEDPS
jgi:hypothetical protein